MRQIFIFNTYSIAAAYGIGTYIKELSDCIKTCSFKINHVLIRANTNEFEVEEYENIRVLKIPTPRYQVNRPLSRRSECYSRSICQLLKPYIDINQTVIFHLNYMLDVQYCRAFRKYYKCKIIFTIHYAEWAFPLFGNKNRYKEIINTPLSLLDNKTHKDILNSKHTTEAFLKACDKVITIASHEAETINELYDIPMHKIETINNGLEDFRIDRSPSDIRKEFHVDHSEKIILFVGRLDKLKGFPIVIKAIELALAQDPKIRLIAVGDGDFGKIFKSINKYWSKMTFTGFLDKENLNKLYSIADIGIIPSMYEEFGYVAVEMMMNGLPIIANQTTGLSEIVVENETGLFVQHDDDELNVSHYAQNLCDKMMILLNDDELRKTMSYKTRVRFLEKYEIKVFKKNMIHLYQSI